MPLSGDFDFIQAKTHGLRSRVYENERLDDLADLRSVSQLWHRLYPDAEPADHHELERHLLADQVHILDVIRDHLPDPLAPFYAWLLRRFQVENLKVLLRAWKAKEPYPRMAFYLAPLPPDLALRAEALLKVPSLADFLLLVPVPEFRKAGEKGAAFHAETGETFFIEIAFEEAYYEGLLAQQQRLPGEHLAATEALVHHEAAIYNILALFRVKLNYGLNYEQASSFFVSVAPHPFRLERIYDLPHFDDMVKLVPRSLLPKSPGDPLRTIADLERALWERLLVVANRQFYRSTADMGGILAFASIKRVELANLIRVIEGVRYAMEPEAIRNGLIRLPEPAVR